MPTLPSEWLSASLTSSYPMLIYTWYLIRAQATLKETSLASASYRHPRHVIMSQKCTACHILLHKYRPEKLLCVTARWECHPGMAPGKRETEPYHLRVLKWNYYLPASFHLKLYNRSPTSAPRYGGAGTQERIRTQLCSPAPRRTISVCGEGHSFQSVVSSSLGWGETVQPARWVFDRMRGHHRCENTKIQTTTMQILFHNHYNNSDNNDKFPCLLASMKHLFCQGTVMSTLSI